MQSGRTAIEVAFQISKFLLRSNTHAHTTKLFLPPDCGNLHRTVYYIFEKELKAGHVILAKKKKKRPKKELKTLCAPSAALKSVHSPTAECGSS